MTNDDLSATTKEIYARAVFSARSRSRATARDGRVRSPRSCILLLFSWTIRIRRGPTPARGVERLLKNEHVAG